MKRTIISSTMEAYATEEQVLFAAKSFLIDRIVPATEKIILPPVVKPSASMSFSVGDHVEKIGALPCGLKSRFRVWVKKSVLKLSNEVVFDFRVHAPQNWSHALNLHLPFALHLIALMKENGRCEPPIFVFPENTPSYIRTVFDKFGLKTRYHDGEIEAFYARVKDEDWHLIQIGRREWLKSFFDQYPEVKAHIVCDENGARRYPRKVFLSRKKTRHILNEEEVFRFLENRGFERIYPEELDPIDQIRLFQQAGEIVAIHGAGLAPVIFKYGSQLRIVEIFSPGHMSEHFRAICSLNGVKWVGVRGVVEPKHVREANRNIKRFVKYSLDGFRVELESLKKALAFKA